MKQQEDNYSNELLQLRQQLDLIDQEIITLLLRRFEITDEVGVLKAYNKKTIEDPVREAEILEKIKLKIIAGGQCEGNDHSDMLALHICEIYKSIMHQSKLKQDVMVKLSQTT